MLFRNWNRRKKSEGVDEESETVEKITSFSFKRRIGKEGIQSKKRGGNGRKEEKREEREVKLQSTSIHVTKSKKTNATPLLIDIYGNLLIFQFVNNNIICIRRNQINDSIIS